MGRGTKTQPRASYEAGNATDEEGAVIDHDSGQPVPPTPRKRRHHVKLETIGDIKSELARLYRQAKAGEIATQDATRLAYLLNSLAGLIESHDLERRIQALEQLEDKP